jgi:RNA polymerase sigma-70 factor (ECF subfamily)
MSVSTTDLSRVAALVAGARAGDEAAFTSLVATYHEDLLRVAFVISGDADTAADAAQLAWNRAWEKLGSVRDPAQVRSWLVAVAANEARQLVRRQRRRTVVEIRVGEEPERPSPDQSAMRVDLANALSRLSPEDRELVALRFVVGLDSTEIAAMRGNSPSGTRARLARVLARLRKELDRE